MSKKNLITGIHLTRGNIEIETISRQVFLIVKSFIIVSSCVEDINNGINKKFKKLILDNQN